MQKIITIFLALAFATSALADTHNNDTHNKEVTKEKHETHEVIKEEVKEDNHH